MGIAHPTGKVVSQKCIGYGGRNTTRPYSVFETMWEDGVVTYSKNTWVTINDKAYAELSAELTTCPTIEITAEEVEERVKHL